MKKLFLIPILFMMLVSAPLAASGGGALADEQNHTLGASEITLVDQSTDLTVKLSDSTREDYRPESRQWNGIATAVSYGPNLFVSWYTGGTKEPHADNYIPVAASDDNGETWQDPFLIVDPINGTSVVLPVFFVNGKGELFLYYSVLPGSKMYAVKLLHADGPLDQITYEGPFQVSPCTTFVKPTILSDGSILYVTGDEEGFSGVYKSTDDGYSYQKIAVIPSRYQKPTKTYSEASVVELADGRLWMLSRLEKGAYGGVEQAFSEDKGLTWTTSEGGLDAPLQGPGSRASFLKLKSGALVFVTNDSDNSRTMLTAHLSEDEGKTWPYSILIDRYTSAYPEIYQDPDGRILIAYDKGRYTENGIRLTILTEEDIRAGRFVSDQARDKLTVTKLNTEWADIVSVYDAYKKHYDYPVGTASSVIRGMLPETFTVLDSNGEDHEVSGTWRSAGYKEDVPGTYTIVFQGVTEGTLLDSYEFFRVTVTLTEQPSGCKAAVSGCGLPCLLGLSLSGLLLRRIMNRKDNGSNGRGNKQGGKYET